jgi:hypothetical protein
LVTVAGRIDIVWDSQIDIVVILLDLSAAMPVCAFGIFDAAVITAFRVSRSHWVSGPLSSWFRRLMMTSPDVIRRLGALFQTPEFCEAWQRTQNVTP